MLLLEMLSVFQFGKDNHSKNFTQPLEPAEKQSALEKLFNVFDEFKNIKQLV